VVSALAQTPEEYQELSQEIAQANTQNRTHSNKITQIKKAANTQDLQTESTFNMRIIENENNEEPREDDNEKGVITITQKDRDLQTAKKK